MSEKDFFRWRQGQPEEGFAEGYGICVLVETTKRRSMHPYRMQVNEDFPQLVTPLWMEKSCIWRYLPEDSDLYELGTVPETLWPGLGLFEMDIDD